MTSDSLKARNKTCIDCLRGFDFSSMDLSVSPNRAVKGKNFIYKNGANHKRNGFNQLLQIYRYENDEVIYPEINGIFEFNLNGDNFLICYAGNHFYSVTQNDGIYSFEDITFSSTNSSSVLPDNLIDRRINMYRHNNSAYFVGAGKLIVFKKYGVNYELRLVENDTDTYVPVTTMIILPDTETDNTKVAFERVNVMTSLRKNTLVGQNIPSGNSEVSYTLDSSITPSTLVNVTIERSGTADFYSNKTSDYTSLYDTQNNIVGSINFLSGQINFNLADLYDDDNPNITVTFDAGTHPMADVINNTEFGIMYGINGLKDRLFLSGNESVPNADFYSESDDFTYFPDINFAKIGSSDSKIMAYSLLGDGTLAIHKEYKNGQAEIYYRKGIYTTDFSNGDISYVNTYFPVETSVVGEGVVSKYAGCTLGNDKLFLSKNGVYSIECKKNFTNTERHLKSKSYFINDRLKNKNLCDAVAITFDNKYFLAVDNEVFIADNQFYNVGTNTYESGNYEWWYWTDVPVRVWATHNNKLCFGTSDGRICEFGDDFVDKIFTETQSGDLTINYESDYIACNSGLNLVSGDKIKIKSKLFCSFLNSDDIIKIEQGKIYVPRSKMSLLIENRPVCVYNAVNCGLTNGVYYSISNTDWASNCFELHNIRTGVKINVLNKNFCLKFNLKNETLKLLNVNENEFNVSFSYDDNVLSLVSTGSDNMIYGLIYHNKNVVCEWFTPMFDFGTSEQSKTLLKMSLSTEPVTNGKMTFGYRTKHDTQKIESKGLGFFSFENMDFNNFSFSTTFASSYTVDVKDDFNYIQFYFYSDTSCDCVVNNLTIIYKNNRYNKGVE